MNKTVERIVEILFQDAEENDEVRATRDEVMANCQERFEDLMARGLTEDEAIAEVIESLRGMDDVVKQYPKKDAAGPYTAFSGADRHVTRIETELGPWDLELSPSDTGRIDVQVEGDGADHVAIDFGENGTLSIRLREDAGTTQPEPSFYEQAGEMNTFADFLRGVSAWAGQIVKKTAANLSGGTVFISAPSQVIKLAHRSTSGDVMVRGVSINVLEATTTSGDIEVTCPDRTALLCVNTTSGDVDVKGGYAEKLSVNATSGDVEVRMSTSAAEVKTMSGDLMFEGCCDRLTVSTISGDAEVTAADGQSLGCIRAQTVSGDLTVNVRDGHADSIDVKTTSGDLDVLLPADEQSVHVMMKSVSGDLHSRVDDAGPDARLQIHAQSVSGDVTVR